jgi:hypothetical protein
VLDKRNWPADAFIRLRGSAQTPPSSDGLLPVLALDVGLSALGSGAVGSAGQAARQQAYRISFGDLGARREEIARALTQGGDLAAALSSDETYQSLLKRRDALQRWQGELDGMSNRTIDRPKRTPSQSVPNRFGDFTGSDAFAPKSSLEDHSAAEAARRPRRPAWGFVKNALYLLGGIAATGGFAAFVQETQVNRPLRDSNPQAPAPDHENLTDVWMHPALFESLEDKNNISVLTDADKLRDFLAERGLSFSGSPPIMRVETAYTFDDPNVQAKFGLKYSFAARDPDQIADILSTVCNANDKSCFISILREVRLHKLDMANLPVPMDAGAVLDLSDRRQEFGVLRP